MHRSLQDIQGYSLLPPLEQRNSLFTAATTPPQQTVEDKKPKAFRFPGSIRAIQDESIATKYNYIQYLWYPGIILITQYSLPIKTPCQIPAQTQTI